MKIEKDKRKVNIVCTDGSLIRGTIHIYHGERVIDFLNNSKENFIAVTNAHFYYIKEVPSFSIFRKVKNERNMISLSKSAIKIVEEING